MVAYSFKRQFVEPIASGRKRQTIRAERKRHARQGETLQLYTGMRTKSCRLIGMALCVSVMPVRLDFEANCVNLGGTLIHAVRRRPKLVFLDDFARSDGFTDWAAMRAFWQAEHGAIAAWSGVLIAWRDFVPAEAS